MSLDVYLYGKTELKKCTCETCGDEHFKSDAELLFEANITHNLGRMAEKAGIYMHLWRPEEINIKTASELIQPLKDGLADMEERPEYYKDFDSDNGWGTYKDFVPWIKKYLEACEQNPTATIEISR